MITDETLLPCPFCGGPGHMEFSEYELCDGYHVICHGKKDCPLYCSDPYRPFDTEAEAAKVWNTRQQAQPLQGTSDEINSDIHSGADSQPTGAILAGSDIVDADEVERVRQIILDCTDADTNDANFAAHQIAALSSRDDRLPAVMCRTCECQVHVNPSGALACACIEVDWANGEAFKDFGYPIFRAHIARTALEQGGGE